MVAVTRRSSRSSATTGRWARSVLKALGSYGAGISRALTAAGLTVVEVARQDRQARRRRGKSAPGLAPGRGRGARRHRHRDPEER